MIRLFASIRAEAYAATPQPSKFSNLTREDQLALFTFADNHRLIPDLTYHLKMLGVCGYFEKEFRLLMEVRRVESERRHRLFVEELSCVCKALNDAKVDYVLLKGAAMIAGGHTLFPGHRYHVDIDFLVQKDHLDLALDTLNEAGFKTKINLVKPVSQYWASKHLPPLLNNNYRFPLECHLRPFDNTLFLNMPVSAEEMLQERIHTRYGGIDVFVPTANHLLLNAFYHSQISDSNHISQLDNGRAMLDAILLLRSATNPAAMDSVIEVARLRKYERTFDDFVESSHSMIDCGVVDSRYLPVAPGSNSKRRQKIVPRNSKIGLFIAHAIRHLREIRNAFSLTSRLEKRYLLKANPDNWKYLPVYRQMTSPTLIAKRIRGFYPDN